MKFDSHRNSFQVRDVFEVRNLQKTWLLTMFFIGILTLLQHLLSDLAGYNLPPLSWCSVDSVLFRLQMSLSRSKNFPKRMSVLLRSLHGLLKALNLRTKYHSC